MINKAMT